MSTLAALNVCRGALRCGLKGKPVKTHLSNMAASISAAKRIMKGRGKNKIIQRNIYVYKLFRGQTSNSAINTEY